MDSLDLILNRNAPIFFELRISAILNNKSQILLKLPLHKKRKRVNRNRAYRVLLIKIKYRDSLPITGGTGEGTRNEIYLSLKIQMID